MGLVVDRRFRGPSTSGNGGYTAGLVAAHVGPGPVTVTLRQPPPLDTTLLVTGTDAGVAVLHGETLVAEGHPEPSAALADVPAVPEDVAVAAGEHYAGFTAHPFPECFVCGTDRAPGDGMRIFAGRLDDGRSAGLWTVGADLAGRPELVWAALDCPGAWAAPLEGRPVVLGRITGDVSDAPRPGEHCVVMGRLLGSEGRKLFTRTTAYGADGRVLGRAAATWVVLRQSSLTPT